MPLTCPRCSTDVSETAMYCPYCNLPRPKKGFTATAEDQQSKPAQAIPRAHEPARRQSKPTSRRKAATTRSRSLKLPVIGALVTLLGIGVYVFVVPLVYSDVAEPKVILAALENLRRAPSNEEGLTIDARMKREIEKSKRSGSLAGYQGWTMKPVKGDKNKVLLVFSYEERDNVQVRAEWLADLTHNTFAPQNELAVSVSQ